jgi:hypothetical protein
MIPQDSERAFFHEGFRLMAQCPLCQNRYQSAEARVLAEKEDAYLLHVPCHKCGSAVVALIFANNLGVNSVGMLTDLTGDEVLSANREIVTADDVLEVYEQLQSGTLGLTVKQ